MPVLSTYLHGVLDYLVALVLVSSPWVLGFAAGGAETWVPVTLALTALLYSRLTAYEWGAWHVLSMRTHLMLDGLSGCYWRFPHGSLISRGMSSYPISRSECSRL